MADIQKHFRTSSRGLGPLKGLNGCYVRKRDRGRGTREQVMLGGRGLPDETRENSMVGEHDDQQASRAPVGRVEHANTAPRVAAEEQARQAQALHHVLRLGLLGPRHMGMVACTSRQGGALADEETVWRGLCHRDFGILYRADR